MGTNKIYLVQLRPFTIKDIALARMVRPFQQVVSENSMKFKKIAEGFAKENYLIQLEPNQEEWFLKVLMKTHPVSNKDFDHFLVNPPKDTYPSHVKTYLRKRSEYVPTLCALYSENGKIVDIERIENHTQLTKIVFTCYRTKQISYESCRHLIGDRIKEEEVVC